MSEFATPLPSGMRVRHIQATSTVVNGKTVVTPVLDAEGHEIELYVVDVPLAIEAAEGTLAERRALIDGFVADIQAKGPDLALVRAQAVAEQEDPAAAETAFTAAQQAATVTQELAPGDAVAGAPTVQGG